MRTIRVLNVLSFTILGCAVMFTDVNAGKKIHIKVQVPKLIKHKHHTNIVFVHKHHHHGGHKKPAHGHHHSHSHGGHHSHSHGEPHGHHHSHSYHHHHHITYNHGHDGGHKHTHGGHKPHHGGHKHHHVGHKPHKPHKPIHPVHKPSHGHKPKPHPKGKHGTNKPITDYGPPENHYSFDENFKYPKTRTQHYSYVTHSPSFEIGDDNKLKELNHTIKHEHTKVETVGDFHPDVENFSEYSKTRTKGSYEVKEEQPFDFYSPEYDPDYGNQNSEYFGKETDDENKDDYSEDYTNPNSVSKYTSAIQHGTIGLENSNYNPDHGNDLEEYINAYKDSFEDN